MDVLANSDEGSVVDVRGRFIIDPDGVIQAIEVLIQPLGRNGPCPFHHIIY